MGLFDRIIAWFKQLFGASRKEQPALIAPDAGAAKPSPVSRVKKAVKDRLEPERLGAGESLARFFSTSLRTRDAEARRKTTRRDLLERYGLPVWSNERELAKALGISTSELWYFANHRFDDRVEHYVRFRIPKRRGGHRTIMAPKRRLKAIQRDLLVKFVERLPVSEHAHGFVKGRSVRTNAEPHVGRKVVIRLDLEDFFGTVHFGRVRGLFLAYGYSWAVATSLALLVTEAERQPVRDGDALHFVPVGPRYCVQGAPTSPGLCNALASRLDSRLHGLAKANGFAYSRYADDMTFSGDDAAATGKILGMARRIIEEEGFRLNDAKTLVMRSGRSQKVTGVTVNEELGLSRKERRKLRAAIHRLKTSWEADPELEEHIRGKLAYLRMLNPTQADALQQFWEEG